jgi:hypothetical protein
MMTFPFGRIYVDWLWGVSAVRVLVDAPAGRRVWATTCGFPPRRRVCRWGWRLMRWCADQLRDVDAAGGGSGERQRRVAVVASVERSHQPLSSTVGREPLGSVWARGGEGADGQIAVSPTKRPGSHVGSLRRPPAEPGRVTGDRPWRLRLRTDMTSSAVRPAWGTSGVGCRLFRSDPIVLLFVAHAARSPTATY